MTMEIERRFLVASPDWRDQAVRSTPLLQGYLCVDTNRTVRIRRSATHAWITLKGRRVRAAAPEFEYEIPLADADAMFAELDFLGRVEKIRHEVPVGGRIWEVDEFTGANAGLFLAEIELASREEAIVLPPWAGEEITGQARYSNSALAIHPFSEWGAADS